MPVEQLIVGWNRGGLGYTYELLSKSGFDTGFTFGPDCNLDEVIAKLPGSHRFEVSPYIVPYLDHPALKDIRVTFILRDPMRVLNSLYFHGLFHNEKNSAVQRAAFNHLTNFETKFKGKPAQASCAYLHNWLEMVNNKRPKFVHCRIEEGPKHVLKAITGYSVDPPFVSSTINASFCKQKIVPSMLPEKSRIGITTLLMRLGYREWAWAPRGGHAHYVNPDWHC
jgi:hypothetical protein